MNLDEITSMMRRLNRAGVTNFAVSDSLYSQFKRKVEEQDADHCRLSDVLEDDEKPIMFRGNRLLRQSDVRHIEHCNPLHSEQLMWQIAVGQ